MATGKENTLDQDNGVPNKWNSVFFIGRRQLYEAEKMQFQGAIDFIDKNPSANISAVATDFGYYDQPAFIRTFKKYTGMTPKNYRELIKQYNYFNRIVLC